VLTAASDAIPLLDDNGSGVYIKGRNNITRIRRQLLGALFGKNASPFVVRPGVLNPTVYDSSAKIYTDLRAIPLGTPGQGIQIVQGRAVHERTGQGPYLVSLDGTLTSVNMPAADATNPRYDVVYTYTYDKGFFADATHGPNFFVETGTPNSSPSVPSIPADAVKIAEIFRRTIGATPSGNIIQTGDIADKRKGASLHGAPRVLLPGDSLSDAGCYHGEQRIRAGDFVPASIQALGIKILYDYWDAANTTWRGTQTIPWMGLALTPVSSLGGNQTATLATMTIPDPGWPYYVLAGGSCLQAVTGGATTALSGTYLQVSIDSGTFEPKPAGLIVRVHKPLVSSPYQLIAPMTGFPTVQTGSHTVTMIFRNESNPSNFCDVSTNEYGKFNVEIIPA
jgi:hypothetical protein